MKNLIRTLVAAGTFLSFVANASAEGGPQAHLKPVLNTGDKLLKFDWPIISVGTGEYAEGPTGVTVIRFARKVYSAVDVRGGGPGTVNVPYMEMGFDMPELDTVVISGGTWYGLEAVTAVASALKDDGLRDGNAFGLEPSVAMSVGSIIFDFGPRRFNEIYPDKKLAQAAFRAARPGVFPLGAHGGGRSAVSGSVFGCHAKSGQGAAFRQVGDLKFAAFTVVNALGVIVDRDGRVVACNRGKNWPENLTAKDLLANFPESKDGDGWPATTGKNEPRNTTISLIVTNQKLSPPELKRLAVQVHSSMSRAIQPYSTMFDGDVLYAVSTAEIDEQVMRPLDLGVVASEVMWDAVLSSVPPQPTHPTIDPDLKVAPAEMAKHTAVYKFSDDVAVRVFTRNNALYAQAVGAKPAFAVTEETPVKLIPLSNSSYTVPGRYPLVIEFAGQEMIMNPGHWQQVGLRQDKG